MAVEVNIEYQGNLRCQATHGPSRSTLVTDAPTDNHGKGEAFAPTDLVATALGSCLLTIMGIVAERDKIDMSGATAHVVKEMAPKPTRRIGKLTVWHHVGRKYFDEIVVNIGRQAGTSLKDIAHYAERDSTYGLLQGFLYGFRSKPVISQINEKSGTMIIDGTKVRFLRSSRNPMDIDWSDYHVRVVVDTTGAFLDPSLPPDDSKGYLRGHLEAGAEKVDFIDPSVLIDKELEVHSIEDGWREANTVENEPWNMSGSQFYSDLGEGLRNYLTKHPEYTGIFYGLGGRVHLMFQLKEHAKKFRGCWLFNNWEEFMSDAWVFPDELWIVAE